MIARGYSREELLGAGLIKQNENGNSWDLLRNRLVLPIRDIQGRTIAFGGRVLDDSIPKYVNSPETELFSKRSVLFNFDTARHVAAKEGFFVVVEGYLDVIAACQRGVENVVAALGTAFTREHVAQLRRYAAKVVLLFDADEGGQRATDGSVSVLLREGLEVQVATLPEGQDPDDFFRVHDRDAFHQFLQGAVEDLLMYLVRRSRERQGESNSASATARAAREVLELLGQTRDPILYDAYVRRISQEFGIEERLVRQQSPQPGGDAPVSAPEVSPAGPRSGGRYPQAWAVDETTLLLAATTDSRFAKQVVEVLSETDFRDPGRKAVFQAVCACLEEFGSASPSLILERTRDDSGARTALQTVLGRDVPPGDSPEMALARALRRREEREYRRLREQVSQSGELRSGEEADLNRRLTEFSRFHAERIAPSEDVGNHSGSTSEQ
ncbi:MAG: toprim domain-containing protein [Planctomycetota bacterium]